MMFVTVRCDCLGCDCNEEGYCAADMGIEIDFDGECRTKFESEEVEK